MKHISKLKFIFLLIFLITISFPVKAINDEAKLSDNINDIEVMNVKGEMVKLSSYKGKVLLIVNVASKCGYTPQYEELEKLYKKYNPEGFEILGFPCNDFGGQEPDTNEQIKEFCTLNYGVTFKLFDKVKVLGKDKCPLYQRLTNNSVTEKGDIKWNFEKFVISKEGKIVARFRSAVTPLSDEIVNVIKAELTK
jgi:glutathione peroxidase